VAYIGIDVNDVRQYARGEFVEFSPEGSQRIRDAGKARLTGDRPPNVVWYGSDIQSDSIAGVAAECAVFHVFGGDPEAPLVGGRDYCTPDLILPSGRTCEVKGSTSWGDHLHLYVAKWYPDSKYHADVWIWAPLLSSVNDRQLAVDVVGYQLATDDWEWKTLHDFVGDQWAKRVDQLRPIRDLIAFETARDSNIPPK
jgi:hypothetical protein